LVHDTGRKTRNRNVVAPATIGPVRAGVGADDLRRDQGRGMADGATERV